VNLRGEACKLQFFAMRSMASGGAFQRAYTNATQQAFLEAHEHAFAYFGGVFRTLRYDNLGSAVKKILRGYQREETERMVAFRSHWGFAGEYCNPARGNEKGGVEGELGWSWRNWLVPVPEAEDLESFNSWFLSRCVEAQRHVISGRGITIGDAIRDERPHLLPLAAEPFPLAEVIYPVIVDGHGRAKVKVELVFDAALARWTSHRPGVARLCGGVARWRTGGGARALLPTRASDSQTGTLWMCWRKSPAQ
jgi:hypothetical protein